MSFTLHFFPGAALLDLHITLIWHSLLIARPFWDRSAVLVSCFKSTILQFAEFYIAAFLQYGEPFSFINVTCYCIT